MRRLWLLLAGLATALVGCSGGTDIPATVTVTVDPDAPETEAAADSSLETFTVAENDIFASQFDPCEVLTDEQFKEAGLEDRIEENYITNPNILGCSFYETNLQDMKGTWLISTDNVSRQYVVDRQLEDLDWGTERNPGIYVHPIGSDSRQCEAAVDYEWGRLVVDYFERGTGWEPEALCAAPVQILDNLLVELGEQNDDQD